MQIQLSQRHLNLSAGPLVMGILNVTPDSFSDGGRFENVDTACVHALTMIADGAAIIDVGPESTKPGAPPVEDDVQIARAIPVIEAVRAKNTDVIISIDTRSANVAQTALTAGADIVNDVSALRDDSEMADVVARTCAGVVLMHRRGTSINMQDDGGPQYEDVVEEIFAFLRERIAFAEARGIVVSQIIVDPGIGFGKRVEHNWAILRNIHRFVALGCPVLIGASRKKFLQDVLDSGNEKPTTIAPSPHADPASRDDASLACAVMAVQAGASIIRTHNVRGTVQALRTSVQMGRID